MKKILFPFETNSSLYTGAFVYSAKFARSFKSELIMLNVFNLKVTDSITKNELDQLIRQNWFTAYKEIIRLNSFYLKNYARIDSQLKIRFDYRILHGNLIKETENILSSEEIDLIILPVPERRESSKKLMELINLEAFERNNSSVLLIPIKHFFIPIKKIVFATNFKNLKEYQILINKVLQFASVFDAEIQFLHLSPAEHGNLPEDSDVYTFLSRITDNSSKHVFNTLAGKDLDIRLEEYVSKKQVQLLIMVRHHHFMEAIFHKFHEEEISLKSGIPVLILKENEE